SDADISWRLVRFDKSQRVSTLRQRGRVTSPHGELVPAHLPCETRSIPLEYQVRSRHADRRTGESNGLSPLPILPRTPYRYILRKWFRLVVIDVQLLCKSML